MLIEDVLCTGRESQGHKEAIECTCEAQGKVSLPTKSVQYAQIGDIGKDGVAREDKEGLLSRSVLCVGEGGRFRFGARFNSN